MALCSALCYWTALVLLATSPAESEATKTVSIRGRVLTPDGSLVAGARIVVRQRSDGATGSWRTGYQTATPRHGGSLPLLTDSEGRFAASFSVSKAGGFIVAAEKAGWVGALIGPIRSERFGSEPIDGIILRRLRVIEGRVLDRQGRPIEGAEVFQTGNSQQRTSTVTNAQGQFRLEDLPDGAAAIFVRKAGFRFSGRFIQASDNQVTLTVARESETVEALRTLPPPMTTQQERDLCRSLVEPLWRKALASRNRVEIVRAGSAYAHVDPWEVVEADRDSFLHFGLYRRYGESPEDTLALIESASQTEAKCAVYLALAEYCRVAGAPGTLELLDRCLRHATTIALPARRCQFISGIAIQLYDLGQVDQATAIIFGLRSNFEFWTDEVARGYVAEAFARIDPQAAIQIVASLRDQGLHERFSLRIAWWLADRDPAPAEALLWGANRQSLLLAFLRQLGLT